MSAIVTTAEKIVLVHYLFPLPALVMASRETVIVCLPKRVLQDICAVLLSIETLDRCPDIALSLAFLKLSEEITLHIAHAY